MSARVKLTVPCCKRVVRSIPLYRHATEVADRRCPRCGADWRVVVRPLGESKKTPGMLFHKADWTCR